MCKIYRVSAYISPRGFSKVFLSYQFAAFATLVNGRGLLPLPTFISRTFALNNHRINNISKYQVITILFKATTLETSYCFLIKDFQHPLLRVTLHGLHYGQPLILPLHLLHLPICLISISAFVSPFGKCTAFVTIWREGFVERPSLSWMGYDGCPELRYCLSYSAVNCWDSYQLKLNIYT